MNSTRATARWSGAPPAASTAGSTGDCDALVEDDVAAFRAAAIAALDASKPVTLELLEEEHALLASRLRLLPDKAEGDDATLLWAAWASTMRPACADLDVDGVRALRPA